MSLIAACRSCGRSQLTVVLDLGDQPLANALIEAERRDRAEATFPLQIACCESCTLLQVTERIPPRIIFSESYPYYSSFLPDLLAHSRAHALDLQSRRSLGPDSLVVEVASNDGYLLKNFVEFGIPVLGIDPADGPAAAACARGVPTINDFFDVALAERLVAEGRRADVVLGNNVLAHVDDINRFVAGFPLLLKPDGIAEFEFPYVRDLVERCAFDTIYHEHVFYYSLTALEPLFSRHGLHLNDVCRLDIHGGSLRLTVSKNPGKSDRLLALQDEEAQLGVGTLAYFEAFSQRVKKVRDDLRALVADIRKRGGRIAAYGAAAKGATLLNFAQLGCEAIDYVVDRNIHKVGKRMPGIGLLIRPVETLEQDQPDYVIILAWNFADEIMRQHPSFAAEGRFIVPIPTPRFIAPAILAHA
jgi:SAM-dependent methyltransferase